MDLYQKQVIGYYKSLESFLGYRFITGKTKHFGYYPKNSKNISENKAQELMSDLVAENLNLKREQLILDAGCGYGVTACYLAIKYKIKIIGIDINSYEVQEAKKRAFKLGIQKTANFKIMDYSKISYPRATFDGIFTLETLSHAPYLQKTLKNFYKLLKPGGKIVLFEYSLAPEDSFTPRELKMLNLGIEGTSAHGLKKFRQDRFNSYLMRLGFRKVGEQNISNNMLPSLLRLRNIAIIPYLFVKLFNLQKYFVNTMIAVEWYELVKKGLIRYSIYSGEK